MDTPLSFGEWVQTRRRALGLSRGMLAQQVGCAVVTIRKIEADERRPSAQIADRLARHLGLLPTQHTTFVRAARAEVLVDRLPPASEVTPHQPSRATRPLPHMPTPRTPLVGREQETGVLLDRILHEDVSLLTLTGPPGVGKTRLALHVAALASDVFADGAHFISLTSISDPQMVAAALAQALGVKESGTMTVLDRLVSFLHNKHMLLVLDNFEHLVGAAPLVAQLLAAAPRVKALATSRAALRLTIEHEFPVAPLALPGPGQLASAELLARSPSVELFVQRVQAVRPSFVLRDEDGPAIAAICQNLDGLPLALELAAAHSKLFTPQALLDRLSSRLHVLVGGMRDLPERQQTLHSAIAWSYDLLAPDEQALFRWMAVFVGGCTLAAAEHVLRTDDQGLRAEGEDTVLSPQPSVLGGLAALVDQSLLRQREGVEGELRFEMLETIREYALERLEERQEADALRWRHASYYLALAQQAEPQLQGGQQVAWMDRLEAEHGNFRAALAYCLPAEDTTLEVDSAGRPDSRLAALGLRLAAALWLFWQVRSYYREGSSWLRRALAQDRSQTEARAHALNGAGILAYCQYDYEQALALFEQSLALAQRLGDRPGSAHALNNIGMILIERSDLERARACFSESETIAGELDLTWLHGWALIDLGRVALAESDLAQAERLFAQSLDHFRSIDGIRGAAFAQIYGAFAAMQQHDVPRAASLLEEGLATFRELKDTQGIIFSAGDLGRVARRRGDRARSIELLTESVALSREQDDRKGLVWALIGLGQTLCDQGDLARADSLLREALTVAIDPPDQPSIAEILIARALVLAAQKRAAPAARLLGACETLRETGAASPVNTDLSDFEEAADVVRALLDPGPLALEWAKGRALTLDQLLEVD